MNELGSLLEIITNHKSDFFQLYQTEVDSILVLHLPECLLVSKNLSPKQIYDELCLHSYAHKVAVKSFARKIIELEYQLRGQPLPETKVIKDVLKRTYFPLASKLLKDSFLKIFNYRLKPDFYGCLPSIADYSGLQYLTDYLPGKKLPKIRKPFIETKRRMIEFLFIQQASQFSRYKNGKLIPPARGYSQFCMWKECNNRTIFNSVYHYLAFSNKKFNPKNSRGLYFVQSGKMNGIRTVTNPDKKGIFFVCSKNCYDALRLHLHRHSLPN